MRIRMTDLQDGDVGIRRFAKLSPDSVNHCAQNLGIQTSQEVSSALVDDASFRIRQVTDTACQFMRHARRKRLTTDDFDKALKWSRVEPLHRPHTGESLPDEDLDLSNIAMATPVSINSIPDPPHVEASWLSIEGSSVQTNKEGETQAFVELKRASNEPNERYMSVLMEALTGDKEDLRRIALTDVQKNPSIANILPEVVLYLKQTFGDWLQFTPQQLLYILKLSVALFHNSNLFLDPYMPAVYPALKAMLLNSTYLTVAEGEEVNHWTVRDMAAAAMAQLLLRCGSPVNDYLPDLHSSFHQVLTTPDPPLPMVYGTVMTLCYLSGVSLAETLYPHMEGLLVHLQGMLDSKLSTIKKNDILRVYETLLLGAELLLTSGSQLPKEHKPPPSSTDQDSATVEAQPPQPPLPKETNNLFSNTSFGLTTESADMEIDNNETVEDSKGVETNNEQSTPSLYDHLLEMFGERLLLRLSTCPQFTPPPSSAQRKTETPSSSTDTRHSRPSSSLNSFLSQEGFKSSKVELPPSSVPSSTARGTQRTFNVHQTRLPVRENILEQKSRQAKHEKHRGRKPHKGSKPVAQKHQTKPVDKGVCASYRRRNSRSGLHSAGVHSAWL